MNEKLFKSMIWIIADEIIKERKSIDDHHDVFHKICNLLYDEYHIRFNIDAPLSESIDLAHEIINNYAHFTKGSDDNSGDAQTKLIPLITGNYSKNFRELYMIGDGSFGTVYKVMNMLDREHYAVKKVPLYGMGYE